MNLRKVAVSAVVGLIALTSTSIASAQFIDLNGDFRDGYSGWQREGLTDLSGRGHDDSVSARLRNSSARVYRRVNVRTNTNYRLRGRIETNGRFGFIMGGNRTSSTASGSARNFKRRTFEFNTGNNNSIEIFCEYRNRTGRFDNITLENRDGTENSGGGGDTAREILGGDWKLNGFSGTLRVGNNDNGLDYADDASLGESHFFFEQSGYAAFRCWPGNPTSGGSSNPRSETREQIRGGDNFWDGTSGTRRTMKWRFRVTDLPPSGKLCMGQIHERSDSFDDVIRVQVEGNNGQNSGRVDLRILGYVTEEVFGSGQTVDFDMFMDTEYYFELTMRNGVIDLYNLDNSGNRTQRLFRSVDLNADECYFKAGCYLQSTRSDHHGSNVFGQVLVRDLSVTPDD